MGKGDLFQNQNSKQKVSNRNTLVITGFFASILVSLFAVLLWKNSNNSVEFCGNGIDDDGNGLIDEASCVCGEGFAPVLSQSSTNGFAVSQGNINVTNADLALGEAGSTFAEIYADDDVLILKLAHELAPYTPIRIYWSSKDDNPAYMIVSESSDSISYFYHSIPFTSNKEKEYIEIRTKRAIRYLRFDKNTITNVPGLNVNNITNSNNTNGYKVYGVYYDPPVQYICDSDWDGDLVGDSEDLDDDNDGIPDRTESLGFDQTNCNIYTLYLENPVLESGNELEAGSIYRFKDVTEGIDALLTIEKLYHCSINTLDLVGTGYKRAFQPYIGLESGYDTGYADFFIKLVKANTTEDTLVSLLSGAAIDIDGKVDNMYETVGLKEMDAIALEENTSLTETNQGNIALFSGGTTEYDGISTESTDGMVFFTERYTTGAFYRTQLIGPTPGLIRQFSIHFNACLIENYDNIKFAIFNPVDTDGDSKPDHLDLDSDNDGIYDAEEAGSGEAYTNGIINGPVNLVGIPRLVDQDNDFEIDYNIKDSDNDGKFNFIDEDSDQDNCFDVIEAGFEDLDGNGQLDGSGINREGLITGFSIAYVEPGTNYLSAQNNEACLGSFPVEWLAFQVEQVNRDAIIYWATASEQNNSHFNIERSFDKLSFQPIGQMDGQGNSNEIKEYNFTDSDIVSYAQERIYYRIKQTDIDGAIDYSNIYQLNLLSEDHLTDINIFPNPAIDEVTISIHGSPDERVSLKIFSITGTVMKETIGTPRDYLIQIGNWPSGTYIAKITGNSISFSRRFVKN